MFDWSTKKRLVRFCNIAEPACNCIGLLALLHFTISYIPLEALLSNPATGGDTGSHFWPLSVLVEHSLPDFQLRNLNPGNLGGEPHFVHYFPMPFIIMAALAQLISVGAAFNLGTLLPLVIFPLGVFCCIRQMGYRFPAPLIAAAMSYMFLFNESYSMWGGNALSLLAGQFAHLYGLVFMLFGLAALAWEMRRDRTPVLSALLFSAVATSHGYVLIGIPALALSFILFGSWGSLEYRFKKLFYSGLYSVLLSIWFLVPMFDNSQWNTAFAIEWVSKNIVLEAISEMLYPVLAVIPFTLLIAKLFQLFGVQLKQFAAVNRDALFWGLPIVAYVGFYFVLPAFGLVDIRAVPQILLFLTLLAALYVARFVGLTGRIGSILLALPLVFLCMFWTESNVSHLDSWLDWNYSGWPTKPLYEELMTLSDELEGDFSDPRVVYEHSMDNNKTGSLRVFEMLPYFTGRATLESVYLQATILAPMVWNIQAYVSKTPSCPFRQFSCPRYDLSAALPRMYMLGVSDYIAMSEELRAEAEKLATLGKLKGGIAVGLWKLYHFTDPPALAAVFDKTPEVIPESGWRDEFVSWFEDYEEGKTLLLVDDLTPESALAALEGDDANRVAVWENSSCKPKLEVDYGRLTLSTPCPGAAHYIRFAYHPAWGANSGDSLFPVSPGFIGIVPSQQQVVLTFGERPLWAICSLVSWLTLIILLWRSFSWSAAKKNTK